MALLRRGRPRVGDVPPSLGVVMARPARDERGRFVVALGPEIPAAVPLGDRQPPRAARHGGPPRLEREWSCRPDLLRPPPSPSSAPPSVASPGGGTTGAARLPRDPSPPQSG